MTTDEERAFLAEMERKLTIIARTGELVLGARNVERLLRRRRAKAILFSGDSPADLRSKIVPLAKRRNVPVFKSTKTNTELGGLCGRPYVVSTLAIIDFGAAPVPKEY
ncbi:MAG: ribosomal L7Ae/L30e/S12e/Gadd45 family protein [Candidatus Geothermarchaeales archaeon]